MTTNYTANLSGLDTKSIVTALTLTDKTKIDVLKKKIDTNKTAISDIYNVEEATKKIADSFKTASTTDSLDAASIAVQAAVDSFNAQVKSGSLNTKDTIKNLKFDVIAQTTPDAAVGKDRLSSIGVTTNKDGTLSFDKAVFTDAFTSDKANTQKILANGYTNALREYGEMTAKSSYESLRLSKLNTENTRITDRIDVMQKALERKQTVLTNQYAKMEASIIQMKASVGFIG